MKPFHSWFCSEGNHGQCKNSLQPIMSGKCECKCHKRSAKSWAKVLSSGGNASNYKEIEAILAADNKEAS